MANSSNYVPVPPFQRTFYRGCDAENLYDKVESCEETKSMKIGKLSYKVVRKLDKAASRLSINLPEFYLSLLKKSQKNTFLSLQSKFLSIYEGLAEQDISDFINPFWSEFCRQVQEIYLPKPAFSFLRSKVIQDTMFPNVAGKWLSSELKSLEEMLSEEELRILLREDYVGRPVIINSKYLTSGTSIHHLYHLLNFQRKTGAKLEEANSIVEWGGGYGNMAKIVKRINSNVTYTVIDIPTFCCIQWIYLSTILGSNNVNILINSKDRIEEGKINLLPVCFLRQENLRCSTDIFIATWSLSESSRFAQDYVESINYFNAKHILFAFQDSNQKMADASRLHDMAIRRGMRVETIDFLPGNYYAFC